MELSSVLTEMKRIDRMRHEELRGSTRRALRRESVRLTRRILLGALGLVALYFMLCIPVAWYQTRLIYWNAVAPMDQASLPAGWTIRRYVSHDPAHQFAAYVHQGAKGMPTVVYLHGRGEGFGMISYNVGTYVGRNWTVVAPEYPGFAGLAGEPDERVINAYMGKVHADLMDRGVDPKTVMIHGNSLGAGPALELAQYPHAYLFLSAPVGSMRRLVHEYVPFYPTILLRDDWDNEARARTRFPVPAQVIAATDDQVVPVAQGHGLALAAAADFHEYPTGGHLIADLDSGISIDAAGRFSFKPD